MWLTYLHFSDCILEIITNALFRVHFPTRGWQEEPHVLFKRCVFNKMCSYSLLLWIRLNSQTLCLIVWELWWRWLIRDSSLVSSLLRANPYQYPRIRMRMPYHCRLVCSTIIKFVGRTSLTNLGRRVHYIEVAIVWFDKRW